MAPKKPIRYEVVTCEHDGWEYQFPVTEPERIKDIGSIVERCRRGISSNDDWIDVSIPEEFRTGYLGWSPTDDFILHMRPDNAPADDPRAYVGRFSYDPRTKEFLPQRISSSHAQVISRHGHSIYNSYMRGIYHRDRKTILIRPYYYPLGRDMEFDPDIHYSPELDDENTWKAIYMLARNGLKSDMKIITKANNSLVREYDSIFV